MGLFYPSTLGFQGIIKPLPRDFSLHGEAENLYLSSLNDSIRTLMITKYKLIIYFAES